MSDDQKPDRFRVKAGSDAIEIEASGSSASRLANSLADALSPFTGLLGAAGDEVSHFRIARREKALSTIMRAKKLREVHKMTEKPVSPKLLAPWLEGASLEDGGMSDISEIWARLLASAPEDFSAEYAYFIDILRKIGAEEAQTLVALRKGSYLEAGSRKHYQDEFRVFARQLWSVNMNEDHIANSKQFQMVSRFNNYEEPRECPGVITSVAFRNRTGAVDYFLASNFNEENCPSISILKSLGLADEYEIELRPDGDPVSGYFTICELSRTGLRLLDIVDVDAALPKDSQALLTEMGAELRGDTTS